MAKKDVFPFVFSKKHFCIYLLLVTLNQFIVLSLNRKANFHVTSFVYDNYKQMVIDMIVILVLFLFILNFIL